MGRLDSSPPLTQATPETSCPFPYRQTCAPLCRVLVTHRLSFGTFVMACANRLSPATKVTSTPTRSWLSILMTTSFAGLLRWPSASPADYSWLDMTTLTSTFGTH